MSGLNKVMIIGNLGNDPDIKTMKNGTVVANISIATSKSYKDQQGVKQTITEWHKISAFGKLAEIIDKYTRKGSKLFVEGELQTRKYIDKDKVERYSTSILVNNVVLLDSRKEEAKTQANEPYAPDPQVDPFEGQDKHEDIPF